MSTRYEAWCEGCQTWHAYDPDVTLAGAPILPCPMVPKNMIYGMGAKIRTRMVTEPAE